MGNTVGRRLLEIAGVSLRLGLTSFGGPVAHLGYFHEEYVKRRKWLDERSYADLVALCQFLPGPASSQVGIGIGLMRGGMLGGLLAFLGFTLPSVVALALFALLMEGMDLQHAGWLHGLKLVAVAIVAQAIWGMGQKLTPDRSRMTIAVMAVSAALLLPTSVTQIVIIVVAGLIGLWLYRGQKGVEEAAAVEAAGSAAAHGTAVPVTRTTAVIALLTFALLLIVLPLARIWAPDGGWLAMFESFYRSGSLVFGGGHVVLPLLEREAIPAGWVTEEQFLAGYGAAQAVPGPLFTFAAYIGAVAGGWWGVLIATVAIFLPAFLLVVGTLPFWNALRGLPKVQGVLKGVNAAVVGILLAAFYDPIWTSSVTTPADFVMALALFLLLVYWKLPPWFVVLAGAAGGMLIG
ncbi:chromate efflux transporter [Paenibacillus chungangensis]|uniref:Chromate efflux transporter n=1 Tax=Paenibacillus chungangensis TaxID=696535 RepID=A0ABW3HQE8_9BACL